jgi:hypothetical protein
MWKNMVETGHRREYGACFARARTHARTQHVTIIAFPLQLCRKRASTIRYMYTAWLAKLSFPRHYYTRAGINISVLLQCCTNMNPIKFNSPVHTRQQPPHWHNSSYAAEQYCWTTPLPYRGPVLRHHLSSLNPARHHFSTPTVESFPFTCGHPHDTKFTRLKITILASRVVVNWNELACDKNNVTIRVNARLYRTSRHMGWRVGVGEKL